MQGVWYLAVPYQVRSHGCRGVPGTRAEVESLSPPQRAGCSRLMISVHICCVVSKNHLLLLFYSGFVC